MFGGCELQPPLATIDLGRSELLELPYCVVYLTSTSTVQPPQASAEELLAAEAEATFTLQRALAAAAALYFCRLSSVAHPQSPWR